MSASTAAPLDPPLAGFLGNLTPEQEKALRDLLAAAPVADIDYVKSPHETRESYGLRLLRARKFDIAEAIKLLAQVTTYYRTENIPRLLAGTADDALGNCFEDEVMEFQPHGWGTELYDRQGRPVYFEKTGRIDIEALEIISDSDSLLRWYVFGLGNKKAAYTAEASARHGRVIDNCMTILDLDGFSMKMLSSASRAHLSKVTAIGKDYFPESMGPLWFINAPRFFTMAWAIIKPMLDERSVAKIQILGDRSEYLPKLLSVLPEDRLPVEYGGKFVTPGGLYKPSSFTKIEVASGKTAHAAIHLEAGQQALVRWFCRPVDMEFHLSATTSVGVQDVRPTTRSNRLKTHEYLHVASAPCKLSAVWDNRKGWRGREVYYSFRVSPAGDSKAVTVSTAPSLASSLSSSEASPPSAACGAGAE